MKKKIFVVLFVLLAARAFSQVNFLSPDEMQITIKQGVQYNLLTNLKNDQTGIFTFAELDMNELIVNTGISSTGSKIDFTLKTIYWPSFVNKKMNFGLGALYHLYVYPELFTENDFKIGLYYRVKFLEKFSFSFDFNYLIKLAVFYDSAIPTLFNHTLNVDFFLDWQINEALRAYTGVLANTFFDYPLSYEPTLTLGIEKYFTEHFMLGAEFNAEWVDWVSANANVHGVNLRLTAVYRL